MTTQRSPLQGIAYGAGAGAVASIPMGLYAMTASLIKDTGFFTPLHHIASLWAPGDAMMESMKAGMAGSNFEITFGVAALGAVIHMMTGAMYGAVFGLVISRLDVRLAVLAAIGLVYGALVFALSAFIGLPLAAAIFDSGDPIKNMAEMAGWGTFFVEHLLFGVVTGALLGARRVNTASATAVAAR
jgi:hypothetical protein